MASVHKIPNSPFYRAAFTGADGKRCYLSTKKELLERPAGAINLEFKQTSAEGA